MKTYGENFVFGSDADGDTYYRASGALARLAKGAAGAVGGMSDAQVPAYKTLKVTDAGIMTNASQPAFLAYNSATDSDVTGDGTQYTVVFDTEVFDLAANYNNATGEFTAPVTGKYLFVVYVSPQQLEAGDTIDIKIVTSNRTYLLGEYFVGAAPGFNLTALADMDAADTAYVTVTVSGGTKNVDIGGSATVYTSFAGCLLF